MHWQLKPIRISEEGEIVLQIAFTSRKIIEEIALHARYDIREASQNREIHQVRLEVTADVDFRDMSKLLKGDWFLTTNERFREKSFVLCCSR